MAAETRVRYDVVGLGLCTHDYLAVVPHIPQFESSVGMSDSSQQGGGPAATATVAASRLGAQAAFVGVVGDDASGDFILDDFARFGVDTRHMVVRPGATSSFVVCLVEESSGDRAFVIGNKTAAPVAPEELNLDVIRNTKYLHVDGNEMQASVAAAKVARQAGVPVVMDATGARGMGELLPLVDILITSRFFYEEVAQGRSPLEVAKSLLEIGPKEVIITLAEQGCACASREVSGMVPAFAVSPVVDTTGCGDVFHGAYIVGKLHGFGMMAAAQFASAVAGLKVRKLGGRAGIPTLAETMAFLQQQCPQQWRSTGS